MSEEDYENLPLDDRIQHKLWKARVHGYQELNKLIEQNPHNETVNFVISNPERLKKIVTDINVAAQESGLKVLLNLLNRLGKDFVVSTRDSIIPGLVEKALISTRPSIKTDSIESVLLYVSFDSPDEIIILMIPSLTAKSPKLVAAVINAINEIYTHFGCTVVNPKLIMEHIPKIFGHADKNVRAEATKLSVTIRSYIGENFDLTIFPNLKPIQQKDLTKLFDKIEPGIQPDRLLKKFETSKDEDVEMTNGDPYIAEQKDSSVSPVFDPYEFADSVDVLSKLPLYLSSRLTDSNWKERVEVLNEITPYFKVMKIQNDDYSSFVHLLMGCLKDVNLQVLCLATSILMDLANGLKKNFGKYCANLVPPLLERTKEKKKTVLDALNGALDLCFKYSSFSEIYNPSLEFMNHKSPPVKVETMGFLVRCLKEVTTPPSRHDVEQIMGPAIKNLQDSQLPVRNMASELIGTLMKIIGPEESNQYFEKIDKRHLKKVQDVTSKASVKLGSGTSGPKQLQQHLTSNNAAPLRKVSIQNSVKQDERKPGNSLSNRNLPTPSLANSSVPSKRTATSPLKENVPSTKTNLTSKSLRAPNMGSYGLSAQQLHELDSLKAEKVEWLANKQALLTELEDAKQTNNGFLKDIVALNGKLDDYHNKFTTMNMTLKSKDTQIFRLRSDLESYQSRNAQLEQRVKFLEAQQESLKNNYRNLPPQASAKAPDSLSYEGPSDDSNEINRRISILSIDADETNIKPSLNFGDAETLNTTSHGNVGSASPIYNFNGSNGNSVGTTVSMYNFDDSDDGWKRATAVTNDLKAKIQKMKARSRMLDHFDE